MHSLGSNVIGNEGAAALSEMLKENKTLAELWWLPGRGENQHHFLPLLSYSADVQCLTLIFTLLLHSLNDNNIDAVGAAALGEAVMQNNTLTALGWVQSVAADLTYLPNGVDSGLHGPVSLLLWSSFCYSSYQLSLKHLSGPSFLPRRT
jgi:hypothetical protein